jgi:hypothetical protein
MLSTRSYLIKRRGTNKSSSKKQTNWFGRSKADPVWVDELTGLVLTNTTKALILDGETAGGLQSLQGIIAEKNITSVTFNERDYRGLKKYINNNNLACGHKKEVLALCINAKTKYDVLINDSMSTPYSNATKIFGHELAWSNMLKQQLPWMFICNCMTTRSGGKPGKEGSRGYSAQNAVNNMNQAMTHMADNAGYSIKIKVGKHNSTPKSGAKNKNVLIHTFFFLTKTHAPLYNFAKENEDIIKLIRRLRVEAPCGNWVF